MKPDCVLWDGLTNKQGYGLVYVGGGLKRKAHRLAYVKDRGLDLADIDGKVVMHKCDTPGCINPDHLELGTRGENNKDRARKGRSAIGSDNGGAKLTLPEVMQIWNSLDSGSTIKETSILFDVPYSTVKNIKTGRNWSHVTGSLTLSVNGKARGTGKLKPTDVLKLFTDLRSAKEIASEYGMSRRSIYEIKSGKTWASVTSG